MITGRFTDGVFTACREAPCAGRAADPVYGCTCGSYSFGDVVFASEHRVNAATRAEFHEAYKAAPRRGRAAGFSARGWR